MLPRLFVVVFPTDIGFLTLALDHPYFKAPPGLYDLSFFEEDDRVNKMKQGLRSARVSFRDTISIENLIFKFFTEFGMIKENSIMGELPRCVVVMKTLGPKLVINSIIEEVSGLCEDVFVPVPSQ